MTIKKKFKTKRFLLYLLRWQASSIVLAPCIYLIKDNAILSAVVANLIGGLIFYWIDKRIFKHKKKDLKIN